MDQTERDYKLFKSYLWARIESEYDRESRPDRVTSVRAAGVNALGAVAFAITSSPGDYQDSVDEIARYSARKAMGLDATPPRLSPVPAPDLLNAIQKHADVYAALLVKQERAAETEHRSVIQAPSGEQVDVRALVKQETAAFLRDMHQGVWQEGRRYEKGQMVTRQGSTWSVQRDGARGKPGDSPDFLLIVKAGRDAK